MVDRFFHHSGLVGDLVQINANRQGWCHLVHHMVQGLAKAQDIGPRPHPHDQGDGGFAVIAIERLGGINIACRDSRHIGQNKERIAHAQGGGGQFLRPGKAARYPHRDLFARRADHA